jgi:hypothetical protein
MSPSKRAATAAWVCSTTRCPMSRMIAAQLRELAVVTAHRVAAREIADRHLLGLITHQPKRPVM